MKSQHRERESDKSEKILPEITRVCKSGSEGLAVVALIHTTFYASISFTDATSFAVIVSKPMRPDKLVSSDANCTTDGIGINWSVERMFLT